MAEDSTPPTAEVQFPTTDDPKDLQKKLQQAIDEGHDADIPSDVGYVLDEKGEEKRRRSIAEHKKNSLSRQQSRASRDLEKGTTAENGTTPGPQGGKDDEGGTSEDEANIVWWDGDDDPENPYNWPLWRKAVNCGLISLLCFITPLASCEYFHKQHHLPNMFQGFN